MPRLFIETIISAMIHEIKIKNFLSFRDEVTFSFEAANDKEDVFQTVKMPDGTLLLRFAIVFGANASGKSNLLQAFEYLNDFWFYQPDDMQESTHTIPFMLDKLTPHQPSEFELSFYVEGVRYRYFLTLNTKQVLEERLVFYKSVQPTVLFKREIQDGQSIVKFNEAVIKLSNIVREKIAVECLPNMSFFAARNKVNASIPLIDVAMNWLKQKVMPLISPDVKMMQFAGKQMLNSPDTKNYLMNFLHQADFNITNVNTEVVKHEIPNELLDRLLNDSTIPDADREQLKREHAFQNMHTTFEHTVSNERGIEQYSMPDTYQSAGTIRTLGLEAAINAAVINNSFLAIDEIEASLHPDLVEYIIQEFFLKRGNSQLLVTTHYDPLLTTVDDLIRKDAVWFTEKQQDGNSTLYSLIEFKGLNRVSSIRNAYRNGRFGAIPNIKG